MKLFEKMSTSSSVEAFNHDSAFGLVVRFSERGFGFGEIAFNVNKATGEVSFDNEEMNLDHCGLIVQRIGDTPDLRGMLDDAADLFQAASVIMACKKPGSVDWKSWTKRLEAESDRIRQVIPDQTLSPAGDTEE